MKYVSLHDVFKLINRGYFRLLKIGVADKISLVVTFLLLDVYPFLKLQCISCILVRIVETHIGYCLSTPLGLCSTAFNMYGETHGGA